MPIDTILWIGLVEAYGLDFDDDGNFIIKNSTQLADGQFKSYHHSFGLFKTKKISTVGLFKNGNPIKVTEYDKDGHITTVHTW